MHWVSVLLLQPSQLRHSRNGSTPFRGNCGKPYRGPNCRINTGEMHSDLRYMALQTIGDTLCSRHEAPLRLRLLDRDAGEEDLAES
jgi:hypothetical protein